MKSIKIPYRDTHSFSNLTLDYLAQKEKISPFYNRFPTVENFKNQIVEKSKKFPLENRKILVHTLRKQYEKFKSTEITKKNIEKLMLLNTFTITTGHQLNLFLGPVYTLYKIISLINLCRELKKTYANQNFIPIYWMASEDHDFEEINHFFFKNTSLSWENDQKGTVGQFSTDGLEHVFNQLSGLLNSSDNADTLRELFKTSYLSQKNLACASHNLINSLFGKYGLVILNPDDNSLKDLFQPYFLKELKEQITFKEVKKTNEKLAKKQYKIQVIPRDLNLFYSRDAFRTTVLKIDGIYRVKHTDLAFSNASDFFYDSMDSLSPNVLLRPVYQEVILPNLCYLAGNSELAYWMQLKSTFKAFSIPFPMLMLRNSALIVFDKTQKKLDKLNVKIQDFFLPEEDLITKIIKNKSNLKFEFETEKKMLKQIFKNFETLSVDNKLSLFDAIQAEEKRQLKGLNQLEKKLLKAEKNKMDELISQIKSIKRELFPNRILQERVLNFSNFYESLGQDLIEMLLEKLNPLEREFTIISLENK